jgi:hypothetical protein
MDDVVFREQLIAALNPQYASAMAGRVSGGPFGALSLPVSPRGRGQSEELGARPVKEKRRNSRARPRGASPVMKFMHASVRLALSSVLVFATGESKTSLCLCKRRPSAELQSDTAPEVAGRWASRQRCRPDRARAFDGKL